MSRARRAVSPETPNDCGLFEGEAFGLVDELVLAGRGVLGERALSDAEELVTDLEARDLRTDRHDRAHDVLARNRILRLSRPKPIRR
jgi:hypothetical protein